VNKGEDHAKTEGKNGKEVVGAQQSTYNPSTDSDGYKFKGGKMNGGNDTLCKPRYQQISVTALGNLTSASSARLLQTTTGGDTYYSMQLTIGSEDFSGAKYMRIALSAFAVLLGVMHF